MDRAGLMKVLERVLGMRGDNRDVEIVGLALQRYLVGEARGSELDRRSYQREYMRGYRRGERRRGRRVKGRKKG